MVKRKLSKKEREKLEHKRELRKKAKARDKNIKENVFGLTSFTLGERYISPFAIAIGATNSMVSLIHAIKGLLGPISQTAGSRLMEKFSRKKISLKGSLIEALLWIPLIFIAILYNFNIVTKILPLILLISFSLLTISTRIWLSPLFSWTGDLVSNKYRGRWFAKRKLISGLVSIFVIIGVAFLLDYFKNQNKEMYGFVILFLLGMFTRVAARKALKKQYKPKLELKEGYYFSFWNFLAKINKTNFGRFTLFRGLIAFAVSITSPLVAVYLLRNLGLSYTSYIIILMAGAFVSIFFLELWGIIADRFGNYKVIVLTMIITPIVPILWILHNSTTYFILIPSIIGNIAWTGFLLSSINLIYDNVSQEKRGLAISYYNIFIGAGIFLGAGLGALLINYWKIQTIDPIIAIFIFGALVRTFVVYVFLPKVSEIKKKKKLDGNELKNILIHKTRPVLVDETHQIMHMKKYIFK